MKIDEFETELLNAYKAGFQAALNTVADEAFHSRMADDYVGHRVHRILAEAELLEKPR